MNLRYVFVVGCSMCLDVLCLDLLGNNMCIEKKAWTPLLTGNIHKAHVLPMMWSIKAISNAGGQKLDQDWAVPL